MMVCVNGKLDQSPACVRVLEPLVVRIEANAQYGCFANQVRRLQGLELPCVVVQVQFTCVSHRLSIFMGLGEA